MAYQEDVKTIAQKLTSTRKVDTKIDILVRELLALRNMAVNQLYGKMYTQ